MRREYWLMASVMVLALSIGCGCSALKPEQTVVRDAEVVKSLEDHVNVESEMETEVTVESSEKDAQASNEPAGAAVVSSEVGADQADSSAAGEEAPAPVVKDAGDQAFAANTPDIEGVKAVETIGKTQATAVDNIVSVPTLITKSENAVTEAERAELFNTLGFELDELIRLLDSLDTVQESDLNLDEFEE